MFDAMKLLGSVIESRSTPSAPGRLNAALQHTGGGGPLQQLMSQFGGMGGQGGGLGGMLGGLMGQGRPGGAGPGSLGGILSGLGDSARQAMNSSSPRQEIERNNPMAVGSLGALAGALLGGGRGAVGGGLLAVLGSLAYSAMQNQGKEPGTEGVVPAAGGQMLAGQTSAMPAAASGQVSAAPGGAGQDDASSVQRRAVLVLRSMIHAAKADGQIDSGEMNRILGKLDSSGEDREARDFVLNEMRGPADAEAIAREVETELEGAEVYAAALMAIEADTPAEKEYLARLAAALKLPPSAVARLHATLGVNA